MKTSVDCLACYLRQALQVARTVDIYDTAMHLEVVHKVAGLLHRLEMHKSPPENSIAVYEAIAEITDDPDPYYQLKKESNRYGLSLLPDMWEEIQAAGEPLYLALRFAIGGNIIDYGAMSSFDVEETLSSCRNVDFALDDSSLFKAKIEQLEKGSKVLYLADNCGEIAFDSLLIRLLVGRGLDVTLAVKENPIINDALIEDARQCGLDKICTVISNGTACPGTPLAQCSASFLKAFHEAGCLISKGQGNFETLSEVDVPLFFLLTIKCSVVGAHLAEIAGCSADILPGKGEMVIYGHGGSR